MRYPLLPWCVLWLAVLVTGCRGGLVAGAVDLSTLSVLSGRVLVQLQPDQAEIEGQDGQSLPEGAVVRTDVNSHALITFFDGSTIELEEVTTLAVTRARLEEAATRIRVDQSGGRVWARVAEFADQQSRFEIASPSAVAAVRGSLIGASVAPDDVMTCWVIEGTLYVTAQGQEVQLAPGQESVTPPGQPPGPPRDRPLPESMLRVRWSGEGFVRLVDPAGRSVGIVPPGVEVNQVRNVITSHPRQQPSFINVPGPRPGDYALIANTPTSGGYSIEITYEAAGRQPVMLVTDHVRSGTRAMATLTLRPDDPQDPLQVGPLHPLTGETPGDVVVRERETSRPAGPFTPVPTLPVAN